MYNVHLSHVANIDIDGGYPSLPIESGKSRSVWCMTLQAAADICREYIRRNGLGSGNWTGGSVFIRKNNIGESDMVQVATVSYNGRIWNMSGEEVRNS